MKARWIVIPAAALMIMSAARVLAQEAPADAALADAALAKKSGCLECHGTEKKRPGPTFRDIAAKYKDDARARTNLIETVKKGGKGNWTEISLGVPMAPYERRLSDAEIKRLVDWVLRH